MRVKRRREFSEFGFRVPDGCSAENLLAIRRQGHAERNSASERILNDSSEANVFTPILLRYTNAEKTTTSNS
ncbi:hypothetical protein [Paenibacillus sedimenti]|uniref:Uncharacterized protein n=1 Tax=Paenibacillus sedimenti TaxID=2770274 RepID=A0A926KVS7_9BACL|nr:hypothetical protein [Paenibacillus sedimenti]MBD0384076.1 hypothetical protein [Paenibacillus sedimenti]